jgi:hypothetical protein
VVPEAQPVVPDTGAQSRPTWVTGPIELPEQPAPGYGAPADGPPAARREPPAPERDLPAQVQDEHAPQRTTLPKLRERSPIFDAMQSEWFQRRTDQTPSEDPVKGWESPADAGFRAAEAVREPVAGKRTSSGLPKRVPGRNRVPGAVASRRPPAAAQPAPQEGTGEQVAPRGPAQTADTVRNRFSSLQSGVRRGRTEARGPSGSGDEPESGNTEREAPSHDEGGNGGAR